MVFLLTHLLIVENMDNYVQTCNTYSSSWIFLINRQLYRTSSTRLAVNKREYQLDGFVYMFLHIRIEV